MLAMNKDQLMKLRQKGKALSATVQIGKNGLTAALIEELKKQLKKRKLVKVKLTKGYVDSFKEEGKDKKEVVAMLAEKTNSELIYCVGFVVVLWRR